ncbi:MAG: hypothetical protein JNN30_07585 [Rhodanobacteraceae bacterium]|nr:hypothetical protein [Rhodanobacteraceae bacterium]
MRKPLAIAALTALLPFTASAQRLVVETGEGSQRAMLDRLLASNPGTETGHLVPMWSTPDGRLLVAVAQSNPPIAPIAPASPQVGGALDWRLIDATSVLNGRVSVRLGEQSNLHGGVSLAPLALAQPGLSLDCVQGGGYLSIANPDCNQQRAPGSNANWYGGNFGASWAKGNFGIDLGLALSWLEPALPYSLVPALSATLPAIAAPGNGQLPRLVIPAYSLGRFSDSAQFGARGSWHFGTRQSLDLGASIGRIRLTPDLGSSHSVWQQKALSLGLGSDTLSASITGRVYSPLRGGTRIDTQRWTGIDLGLTWHTPWQAELSIGAQNLLATPPLSGTEAENQARTPYVQYQQDL